MCSSVLRKRNTRIALCISQCLCLLRCPTPWLLARALCDTPHQVLIASIGKGLLEKRMEIAKQLLDANIAVEYGAHKLAPNLKDSLYQADEAGIPIVVLFGESEIAKVRVPADRLVCFEFLFAHAHM